MDPKQINEFVTTTLLPLGADLLVKIGGAILFWLVGKRIVGFAASLYTGVFCTRLVFEWWVRGAKVKRLSVGAEF